MRRKEGIVDDALSELMSRLPAGFVRSQSRSGINGPEAAQRLGCRQANQNLTQDQGQAEAQGEQKQPFRHTSDSPLKWGRFHIRTLHDKVPTRSRSRCERDRPTDVSAPSRVDPDPYPPVLLPEEFNPDASLSIFL